jgi:hypothetical protein
MRISVGNRYVCRGRPDILYVEIVYKTNNWTYPYIGIPVYREGVWNESIKV